MKSSKQPIFFKRVAEMIRQLIFLNRRPPVNPDQPIFLNQIASLTAELGVPKPRHAFVAIVDHNAGKIILKNPGRTYQTNFYTISFRRVLKDGTDAGQDSQSFGVWTLSFLPPRHIIHTGQGYDFEGYDLYLHEKFIHKNGLTSVVHSIFSFSNEANETLFLTPNEKEVIALVFEAIANELRNLGHGEAALDEALSWINQLFNYSKRFFARQLDMQNRM